MKEKVNVTGVPETMVQTLYARAKETRKKNAKIKDEIAVELVKKLDYDFSKADKDKAMSLWRDCENNCIRPDGSSNIWRSMKIQLL